MKGPLHVIRRRRTERPANGVETAQAATEAPTQAQPTAGLASTPPPPAADQPPPAPDQPPPAPDQPAPAPDQPAPAPDQPPPAPDQPPPAPDQPPPAADQPAPAAGDASAAPLTAEQQPAAEVPAGQEPVPARPSFRQRGRLRRRLRYLRRVRELGFRDLGGLVFDQHRFSQANEALVDGKFSALAAVDGELRALEHALDDRRSLTELREPGVSVCSRCGALHGSEARFCPSCGTPVRGPLAIADVGEAVSLPAGEPHAAGPTPAPPLSQALTPVALQLQPLAPTPEPEPAALEQPAEPVAPEPPAPGEQPTEVMPPVNEDALHPPDGGEAQQPVAHRSGERGEP
jgi:ribosomal protein L40E